jgi:hypothetical protein
MDNGNATVGVALYQGSAVNDLIRITDWRVQAGEVYQIEGYQPFLTPGASGLRTFQLILLPPPANDYFTNSIQLEGTNPQFEGYTHGATREPGEKARGAHTLWWHWLAPTDGVAQLKTSRDDYYGAVMDVFQGDTVNNLTPVPYVSGDATFDVKAGDLYRLAVAGNMEQDNFRFHGQVILSPLRIESPLSGTVYPSATDVVVSLGSALPASAYGSVSISTSNGYPRFERWGFVPEMVFSNLPAGMYSIRASAWDSTGFTNYVSPAVVFRVLLPNDDFSNSIVLEATNPVASGDMRNATAEPGEIDTNRSVWWRWTAPEGGWAILSSFHGNTPQIQVFRGEKPRALTLVPHRPELPGLGTFGFPIEKGGIYHFRATGDALPSYPSDFFRLTLAQAPPNDDLTNGIQLSGDRNSLSGLLFLATQQAGEPTQINNSDFASIWYSWTAPAAGILYGRIIHGNDWRDGVAIFSGDSLPTLRFLGPSAQVQPGQTYQIALFGNRYFTEPISAELSFFPPPANDLFQNAQLLPGSEGEVAGQDVAATGESVIQDGQYKTVWYQWTAPSNGMLSLATLQPPQGWCCNPNIAVYLGTNLDSLTRVDYRVVFTAAGSNGEPGWWTAQYDVRTETNYHIVVFSEPYVSDPFTLRYHFFPAPTNDVFANRTLLQGTRGVWSGSNQSASHEGSEPVASQPDPGRSLWYSWTAPFNGTVYYGFGFPFSLATYAGTNLSTLTPATRTPDTLGFYASQGTTYAIALDSMDWAPGVFEFSLLLRHNTAPPNDQFANRIALTEGTAPIEGWNQLATREWHEPNHAGHWGGRSVWYSWTPAVSGPAVVRVSADEHPLLIGVYEGKEVAALLPVAAYAFSSQTGILRFPVLQGHEYAIALDGELGATTEFEIQVNLTTADLPPFLELVEAKPDQWNVVVRNLVGRKVRLESSTNFQTWEPQASSDGGTDDWQWPLSSSPRQDQQDMFFRAVILP